MPIIYIMHGYSIFHDIHISSHKTMVISTHVKSTTSLRERSPRETRSVPETSIRGFLFSAPAKRALSPAGTWSFSCQQFWEMLKLNSSERCVPLEVTH